MKIHQPVPCDLSTLKHIYVIHQKKWTLKNISEECLPMAARGNTAAINNQKHSQGKPRS